MNPDSDKPATRGDLDDLRTELKADLAAVRTATRGDLDDLRTELKADLAAVRTELKADLAAVRTELKTELRTELTAFEERITRSVSIEMGRIANVIMEHTTSQIRAAGDHPKAIEERLDAHIADASVHRRPSRR